MSRFPFCRLIVGAFLLGALAGCASRSSVAPRVGTVAVPVCAGDPQVPPFACVPYEPFSRADAVAIAEGEWRAFGSPVDDGTPRTWPDGEDKPERAPGLWERVGLYWWLGQSADNPERAWTGKHDAGGTVFPPRVDGDYAWSAAFISYVMRMAGAGARFPYADNHATYINVAARQAQGIEHGWVVTAAPADAAPPQVGDLICTGRDRAAAMSFARLPTGHPFPAHCDIVVGIGAGRLESIGGNLHDAVSKHIIPLTVQGTLAPPGGKALDPNHSWFVVLRVQYDR